MNCNNPFEAKLTRRFEGNLISVWVVGVVVGNNRAVYGTMVFKSAFCSGKVMETFAYGFGGDSQNDCCSRCSQSVFDIVLAGNGE